MLVEIKLIAGSSDSPVHLKEEMSWEIFKMLMEQHILGKQIIKNMEAKIESYNRGGTTSDGDYTDYNYHPG